ncbi:type II toxin-antitoxin system RelE/ParE family toxin [Flavobacterium olei]|uniref:type II toxin-antitoxin system RelE/ParE family toxin n=1 Tax=Flavobacterium olei TaxID=1886782 RepID=UPI00321A4841
MDENALKDLREIVKWYSEQSQNLGTRFHKQVKSQINYLKTYPFVCTIRYQNIRCMLVKKFPFMIHYIVNEELNVVEIYSIFHTSRNPEIWNSEKR